MAITNANFNASDYLKASGKRIITCTSDKIGTTGVFNYRFLLELTINSTVYSFTFRPNNENYGFINISKILQTHIKDVGDVQQLLTIPEASTTGTVAQFKQNIHSMPYKNTSTTDAIILDFRRNYLIFTAILLLMYLQSVRRGQVLNNYTLLAVTIKRLI